MDRGERGEVARLAGAAEERQGSAEITQVRQQREAWQREATWELATGRTDAALARYEATGSVLGHGTEAEARAALVTGWDAVRRERPEASQVMLAGTNADVLRPGWRGGGRGMGRRSGGGRRMRPGKQHGTRRRGAWLSGGGR